MLGAVEEKTKAQQPAHCEAHRLTSYQTPAANTALPNVTAVLHRHTGILQTRLLPPPCPPMCTPCSVSFSLV